MLKRNIDIKIRFSKFYQLTILLFLIILLSNESFWFSTSGIHTLEIIKNLFISTLPVVLFLLYPYRSIFNLNTLILFGALTLLLFSATIIHANTVGGPIMVLCTFFSSYYISRVFSLNLFIRSYNNIIYILCLWSLLFWFLITIHILSPSVHINIANSICYHAFGNIYFDEGLIYRNSGIFREPGVFMIFINISIIFELFTKEQINIKRVSILLITLISTFSTGGIMTFIVIVMAYLISQKKITVQSFLFFIAIGLGIYFFISNEFYYSLVFDKLNNITEGGSGGARYVSIVIPIYMLYHNPIFGVGYTQFPFLFERLSIDFFHLPMTAEGQGSNTILTIGAIWGLWMVALIIWGLYKFVIIINPSKNKLVSVLLFLSFLLMLSNESMIYCLLLYIIIFYGLTFKENKKAIAV